MNFEIPYYQDFISEAYAEYLLEKAASVHDIDDLLLVGESGGLESKESLEFLIELYQKVKEDLKVVLENRIKDRKFIDERNKALRTFNENYQMDFASPDYQSVLGLKDAHDRIVVGPHSNDYTQARGEKVAPIPDYLQGYHVTLFGPPDSEKMCVNAMNAFHRKLQDEPKIVEELLKDIVESPKWGADNEDSKTPLHSDLKSAGINLTKALEHKLDFTDSKGKQYKLAESHLSHAIKRFPGLALPCPFLYYEGSPLPLHLYDFALHAFANWQNKQAMVFYIPKLENEEEARYIHKVMHTAETMLKKLHPEYEMGTIRLMIVLENPRAVFRVNEIMDELHPYFVGASLGWHDYLASTARLFKDDPHYRIPVKADPDIVIKYIKASHRLLADVVGARGGIKVGGMYGILPMTYDLHSPSFQVTLLGYIRDVVTQFKRNLNGFWVAHPDFVRLGMAMVQAWKIKESGDALSLEKLVKSLLHEKYHQEVMEFIHGPDIEGLDPKDPLYARSLLVADVGASNIIANNDPKEIRYNVFQSLQYITDWLSGNGCVALPTNIGGEAVRIMDDLATAERSRWEVWHEIYHGRFDLYEFLKIAHEELNFIRKDLSDSKKIVQVKWTTQNAKWYPVALKLMIKLMTDSKPVEFATELLLPFTIDEVRNSEDPWSKAESIDPYKYQLDPRIVNFNYYFERCGEKRFAQQMCSDVILDENKVRDLIMSFSKDEIISAASFHGNIGEAAKTLDAMAKGEQSKVLDESEQTRATLRQLGQEYWDRFGMKFLISAKDKSAHEILKILEVRMNNSEDQELENARIALLEITLKRVHQEPLNNLVTVIERLREKFQVKGLQIALTRDGQNIQSYCSGQRNDSENVDEHTFFEIASLSKTIGTALALYLFRQNNISIDSPVNRVLKQIGSNFQLDESNYKNPVLIKHLMEHTALNMHYVNGVPLSMKMPKVLELLSGNQELGYVPAEVIHEPGRQFQYSGAGFILLEHILECLSGRSFTDLLQKYMEDLSIDELGAHSSADYAWGYKDDGEVVTDTRLQFPLIAAGMMGTSRGMLQFLAKLTDAYHSLETSEHLSHDNAVTMLYGQDKGSKDFMGCLMGLGVFTAECGPNKVMVHQGANDGYRAIYIYCYQGPDRHKGFSLFCNGELNGVFLNSLVAQLLVQNLKFEGINFDTFSQQFDPSYLKQEEIVNYGYKNFIFDSFIEDLPEVSTSNEYDPLSEFNILNGAQIVSVTNQKFARASNLLLSTVPKFDPELFGRQGKVMDSWETVRHNAKQKECLHLVLTHPRKVKALYLSTKYHDGNHIEYVSIDGLNSEGEWINVLAKTHMQAHSFQNVILSKGTKELSEIKVYTYPDGGFTRLKLFEKIPENFQACELTRFAEKIPATLKSPNIQFISEIITSEIGLEDVASAAAGAKVISATNEHYSPASQVISPYAPINMFDGLETARSRKIKNVEEVTIELSRKCVLSHIDLDFTYFVNNNPVDVEIMGLSGNEWKTLVARDFVKPFAGNKKRYPIHCEDCISQIKLRCFPDGGMNRIHVYAK